MSKDKRLENLKDSILDTLEEMKEVRKPTEDTRWTACSLVKHRTSAFNLGNSIIKPIPLYTNIPVEDTDTAVNGIMGYLISQNIRWFTFS